jgi:DNA-binding transcriptional LysR family regulator
VIVHFDEVASVTRALNFPELRARTYDLVLARGRALQAEVDSVDDFNVDVLFDDQLVIVAGPENRWGRRRKIDLAELVDEPWIMQAPYTWNYQRLTEAFQARGLAMPRTNLVTISIPLFTHFLSKTPHITACPKSVARFNSLTILPVDLPARPWPVGIVTLKHRTLSPVVERFIMCAREVTNSITGKLSRQMVGGRRANTR